MSPWLNDPVAIGVGTDELVIGAGTPWWMRLHLPLRKPSPASEPVSFDIPEEQRFTEAGVLDALRAALSTEAAEAEKKTVSKRSACVVLDDFWGNHAIVRGDFRTLRAHEIEEIVCAHFSDLYGIDVRSVLVRFSVQRGGRAVFASAMSRSLHDGIHDVSAALQVDVRCIKLCLPETLNRIKSMVGHDEAMLLFLADTLMQAVLVEENCWAAYDAQRLFAADAGSAPRIAALAEQAFERLATRGSGRREDYRVYLYGVEIDPAPFDGRFCAALRPDQPSMETSVAHRLMEVAQ